MADFKWELNRNKCDVTSVNVIGKVIRRFHHNTAVIYNTPCPKNIVPIFIFFSRCPVCGEWCKLHLLLLDTPSFD